MTNFLEFETCVFRDDRDTMAQNVNLIGGKALCEVARAALRKAGFKAGDIWDEDHGWAFYAKEFRTKTPGPYFLVTGAIQCAGDEDVETEAFIPENDSYFEGEEVEYPALGTNMWATLLVGRVRSCRDQLFGRNKQTRDCPVTATLVKYFSAHADTVKVKIDYV